MLHGSPSPGIAASELTHLLNLWAAAPPASGQAAFAARLGDWLGWTGAIALSSALNGGAAAATAGHAAAEAANAASQPLTPTSAAQAEAAELQRVVDRLAQAIAAGPHEPPASADDFGPWRRHCAALQQAMAQAIGGQRQRLRAALARRSPEGARLAALDAVLDQHLANTERQLLGLVPLRLQARFDHLRLAATPGWPQTFRHDLDRLLRAELAHRLLPAQGLLDALRTPLA